MREWRMGIGERGFLSDRRLRQQIYEISPEIFWIFLIFMLQLQRQSERIA
ncbi:hypothetical protein [Nodularia sphaerocarpa]|nr:hypothetical protein [Nodularia sphaerocarpa]MDB9375043.1 hypothetical protein [Nodularia sphaerocarpa CS-585]